MGEATKIAWCDHTFNAWIGCAKISDGCKNCYAAVDTFARRSRANGLELWGVDAARHRTSLDYWKQPIKWNRAAENAGVRRRVFCASLADVFEDRRDLDPWRADLFSLIEKTPWLDWLLLTKRPQNMNRLAPLWWSMGWPANAWAMTTVENQEQAEIRIPELLQVPAAIRGLSIEPQLGPIDLDLARCDTHNRDEVQTSSEGEEFCNECAADGYSGELSHGHWLNGASGYDHPGINWVIVGGESGTSARPFNLAWAKSIIVQCAEEGVPVFFKQAGAHVLMAKSGERVPLMDRKGGDLDELSVDMRVRQWPELSSD